MGTQALVSEVFTGGDGNQYCTVRWAAIRLGTDEDSIRRMYRRRPPSLRALPAAGLVNIERRRPGRPQQLVIPVEDVEERRYELLKDLGVTSEHVEGFERLQARIRELEREVSDLRQKLISADEALRLSIVIDRARLDQLSQYLTPGLGPNA